METTKTINLKPFLELQNVKKLFGTQYALKGVNLRVFEGKCMGILGENGAGKSTLMNILSGVIPRSSGKIISDGKILDFKNIKEAETFGISIIHQEIVAFDDMTVIDNMFVGHEDTKTGFIKYDLQKKITKKIFKDLNLEIDLKTLMSDLTIAEQQMIEIAKAIMKQSKILIFDEPTSSLSKKETESLFNVIQKLKSEGKAILYISHKLEEIPIICEYITIIRDGEYIGEYITSEIDENKIIAHMVGREVTEKYPTKFESNFDEVMAEFKDISGEHVQNSSFKLYKNEILGFFGLVGAGRTELFKTIIGQYPKSTGTIIFENKPLKINGVSKAIKNKIYYVTEDRKNDGLILDETISKNISISSLKELSRLGFIKLNQEKKMVNSFIKKMSIKTSSGESKAGSLSGGNQQKVLLAKAFAIKPKLIILDEPTKGVDVGSRREIYDLVMELKKENVGVIIISSDMSEIVGMCNRVIVMKNKKINGTLTGTQVNPETIIKLAL